MGLASAPSPRSPYARPVTGERTGRDQDRGAQPGTHLQRGAHVLQELGRAGLLLPVLLKQVVLPGSPDDLPGTGQAGAAQSPRPPPVTANTPSSTRTAARAGSNVAPAAPQSPFRDHVTSPVLSNLPLQGWSLGTAICMDCDPHSSGSITPSRSGPKPARADLIVSLTCYLVLAGVLRG